MAVMVTVNVVGALASVPPPLSTAVTVIVATPLVSGAGV
jgi:hypothetical protein